MNCERHHLRFAQRIDRRIRDLREPLLAVIPQRARQRRKKRRRRVVAHAPVGFLAVRKRGKQNLELILGPASGSGDALRLLDARRRGRRSFFAERANLRQRIARLLRRKPLQNLAPTKNRSGNGVRENHLTRAKTLAFRDARFRQIHKPRFRSRNQQSIVRQRITQRPQPIAIELCPNKIPVRENQRRRSIPRLAVLRQRRERPAHIAR
jgi:hypothetical protein